MGAPLSSMGRRVAIPRYQQGMIGKADHALFAQNFRDRAFHRQMGFFIDDHKDFVQRPAKRFCLRPSRQFFRNRVD